MIKTLLVLIVLSLLSMDGHAQRRHRGPHYDSIQTINATDSCQKKQKQIGYKNGHPYLMEEYQYHYNCSLKQSQSYYYRSGEKKMLSSYDPSGRLEHFLFLWKNGNKKEEGIMEKGTMTIKFFSKNGRKKKREIHSSDY